MEADFQPPGFQIQPRQLTWLLILVTTVAFAFTVVLLRRHPARPKPQLLASMSIRTTNWAPPNSEQDAQRFYPCAIVTNDSKEVWQNVVVSLDKQFYFYSSDPLAPTETLTIPLEHFVTKGGNVTFRPSSQEVHKMILFAQLPNGDRGICEAKVEYPGALPSR